MSARAAFVYLHGFASGPSSRKAVELVARFAGEGVALEVPDLNEGPGGFHGLTIGRMLAATKMAATRALRASGLADHAPLVVMGSSLGGFTAAHLAAREPSVVSAVLLAPAFDFARRLKERIEREDGDGVVRATREFPVFHHAWKRDERCGMALLEEGLRYEAFPDVRVPACVIHGRRDDVVPSALSEQFASGRANVRLHLLDDDHMLHASSEQIWQETRAHVAAWLT
jgi:pimeloyl-ACP methyl ester carboxylesterase